MSDTNIQEYNPPQANLTFLTPITPSPRTLLLTASLTIVQVRFFHTNPVVQHSLMLGVLVGLTSSQTWF